MENNWKEIANNVIYTNAISLIDEHHQNKIRNAMIEFANLVFEATKKECADKAKMSGYDAFNGKPEHFTDDEYTIFDKDDKELIYVQINIDKESILNITKPNL